MRPGVGRCTLYMFIGSSETILNFMYSSVVGDIAVVRMQSPFQLNDEVPTAQFRPNANPQIWLIFTAEDRCELKHDDES